MATLGVRARGSLAALTLVLGVLLFGIAGTVRWWQAWVFLALMMGLGAATTEELLRRDPALLERRMKGGPMAEPRPVQRVIMLGASVGFVGLLALPALDFRLGWSAVPTSVVILGDLLLVIGIGFVRRVYRENTYAAATIQVAEHQRVISTGPYAVVRHPMYASALLYVLGIPLALGSYVGLLAFAFFVPVLVWRIVDEERMLTRELPGYAEYQSRVRHRLVPYFW